MTQVLFVPVAVWVAAQLIKFGIRMRQGDLRWGALISAGGMPSAHTAGVTALATTVGFTEGTDSALFAVTVIFAAVIAYDAMGVRRATGEQARLVNRIVERLLHGERNEFERLREELGHRPVEVLAGIVLGVGGAVMAEAFLS